MNLVGVRTASVEFKDNGNYTEVIVIFEPEEQNSIEMQKTGWQAILNNYKQYTENN